MALMLKDYVNQMKLHDYIRQGLVDAKQHTEFPLVLYCYGRKAVYDNMWDEVTTRCRGLIVNAYTGEIIARPFEKFFNLGTAGMPETHPENLFPNPHVTEKLDGSLGILYEYDGKQYIASKGSFTSEHAKWATDWYRRHVGYRGHWPKGYTPVFEMICEKDVQRHVVSYGGRRDGLVLTALISIETGWELPYDTLCNWAETNRLPYVRRFDKTVAEVLQENNPNEEGYVLTWPLPGNDTFSAPFRVKVKFVDFLKLQRVLHSVGPKEILDALRHKHLRIYFSDWLNADTMPKEFIQYVHEWMQKFGREYGRIKGLCHTEFQCAKIMLKDAPRKEYALRFTKHQYPAILFAMLDGMTDVVDSMIWEQCKPLAKESKPLWEATDGEE